MRKATDKTAPAPAAIILAAGKGTRMPGELPKVVYPVGGRAMIRSVVDACRAAGCARIVVIVGYQQERVRQELRDEPVEFAVQDALLGTGHAVRVAESLLSDEPEDLPVFVLCGDGPLIRPATLRRLLDRHRRTGAAATLATAVIEDPTGYGRIIRDAEGRFLAIVEQRSCTPEQAAVHEINPSYYCFQRGALFEALGRVGRNPDSGEYYLTDVPGLLMRERRIVEVLDAVPPEDVYSINTPEELARVDRIYRTRLTGAST